MPHTYVYDKRNKLVKATTPSNTVTYQYAPNGLRTQQVVSGVTTDYLVDAYSGYGDVVAEYESGIRSKIYTIGDDLISQTMGTNTFYFGYDGLGSTRMLFDDSASVTDTYDYTAFGEVHGQTGSTDNAYQFTGEQYDDTLGQYYLRARYYNQAIGRFTQLDTYQGQMSDPTSLHKYLYTANDPINMIDPTGHFGLMSLMSSININGAMSLMSSININGAMRGMSFNSARHFISKVATQLVKAYSYRAVKYHVRRCIKSKGKRCILNVPIVNTGNDIPETSQHILDAQLGRTGGDNLNSLIFNAPFYLRY